MALTALVGGKTAASPVLLLGRPGRGRAAGRSRDPAQPRPRWKLLQACGPGPRRRHRRQRHATRSGRPPTGHCEAHHRRRGWSGDAERFGVGAAILVGDLFLVWSDQLFSASGLGGAALERGRRLFDLMRTEVMAGQYLDIVAQSLPQPDPEVIATVLRYKSARYSVERPLQIGAALAGGSDELHRRAFRLRPARRRGVPAAR